LKSRVSVAKIEAYTSFLNQEIQMVRHALKLVCLGFMTMFLASCGQTYELQSITVSPTQPNIEGMSTPQALTVTAHYSNTKTEDVTVKAQYSLGSADSTNAPAAGLTLNKSGILETTTTPACSWVATLNSDGTTYSYAIVWPYTATATYSGFTATAGVSVASAAKCYDGINFKKT
jgi:hypothetical protein